MVSRASTVMMMIIVMPEYTYAQATPLPYRYSLGRPRGIYVVEPREEHPRVRSGTLLYPSGSIPFLNICWEVDFRMGLEHTNHEATNLRDDNIAVVVIGHCDEYY